MAEAIARYRQGAGASGWEVRFSPCGAPIEVGDGAALRQRLLRALVQAQSQGREGQLREPLWLRTEPCRGGHELRLSAANTTLRVWRFEAQPRQGAAPRRRFGRPALVAQDRWPHLRRDGPKAVCLVSGDQQLIEWCRAVVGAVGGAGIWHTASLRRAQLWLLGHPRCPLLLVDAADGWWCIDLASEANSPQSLPRPQDARQVHAQLRKYFHHRVESAG